jgi:hypothetical protein
VRPYVLTRGRTVPVGRPLADDTIVVRAEAGEPMAVGPEGPLTPEAARLVDLCAEPTFMADLADVAAALGLLPGVVRVIAGDLLATGRLRVEGGAGGAEAGEGGDEDERAAG